MNDWSLICEYIALIILLIIALFMHGSKSTADFRKQRIYFYTSLMLSALSILCNITCVFVTENIASYGVTLAIILNSLYFFITWAMVTAIVYYLFLRLLEFDYHTVSLTRAKYLLLTIFFFFSLLLVLNLSTGILFYFNEAGVYCRGPFNSFSYVLPLADVILLLIFYVRHRRHVGIATEKVLFVAAPISLLLIIMQVEYPNQLLNGIMCAIVNLIMFISYGSDYEDRDLASGLDNRHSFMNEFFYRTEKRQSYQVIMIQLRHLARIIRFFKRSGYNSIIFQLGNILRRLSESGMAFRYSEDTFALIFTDANPKQCSIRLQHLLECLKLPMSMGQHETNLSFSIVDFRYDGQPWSVEDIITYLNNTLHTAAKTDTELIPFTEQHFYNHRRREHLLKSMRSALAEGRFSVWYQPIYYHSSGKFESAEALLRMTGKTNALISPADFIPIAEETGLLDELLEFLLESVCRLLQSGKIKDLNTVSINLPIREVAENNLKERFDVILHKYGISPGRIKLEITERDIEENGEQALSSIQSLVDTGYRFMLDDFGTGYSNLRRVLTLPLESVKLDRSLVLLLEDEGPKRQIIKDNVIPLLKTLGQNIVAEGVETKKLADILIECGVDRIQGFYYAKPMPENELYEWYRNQMQ